MSLFNWRCIEPKCPNEEAIEPNSNCPECGAKAQKISFLDLNNLITSKRKEARLKEKTLITPGMDFEAISQKIDTAMHDLATLQTRKYPKQDDDVKILTLLAEINVLQSEETMRLLLNLQSYFQKLFGSL